MTKDELWQAYAARNPSFAAEGQVTMTSAGLRKLFDQTWNIAFESATQKAKREAELLSKLRQSADTRSQGADFFNSIFGK